MTILDVVLVLVVYAETRRTNATKLVSKLSERFAPATVTALVVNNRTDSETRESGFKSIQGTNNAYEFSGYAEGVTATIELLGKDRAEKALIVLVNDTIEQSHSIYYLCCAIDKLWAAIANGVENKAFGIVRRSTLGRGRYISTFLIAGEFPVLTAALDGVEGLPYSAEVHLDCLMDEQIGAAVPPWLATVYRTWLLKPRVLTLKGWHSATTPMLSDRFRLLSKLSCIFLEDRLSRRISELGYSVIDLAPEGIRARILERACGATHKLRSQLAIVSALQQREVYVGHFGQGSIGDLLIQKTIEFECLTQRRIAPVFISGTPFLSPSRPDVVRMGGLLSIYLVLFARRVVVGGGGILFTHRLNPSLLVYAGVSLVRRAIRRRIEVCRVGVSGVCNRRSRSRDLIVRWLLSITLGGAQSVSVRDERSWTTLAAAGVVTESVRLELDYIENNPEILMRVARRAAGAAGAGACGLVISDDFLRELSSSQLERLIRTLRGGAVEIAVLNEREDVRSADLLRSEGIAFRDVGADYWSICAHVDRFSSSRLIYTSRLHAAMLHAAAGANVRFYSPLGKSVTTAGSGAMSRVTQFRDLQDYLDEFCSEALGRTPKGFGVLR